MAKGMSLTPDSTQNQKINHNLAKRQGYGLNHREQHILIEG
jgi:hypothetical protein